MINDPPPTAPPARSGVGDEAWRAEVGAFRGRERRRRFPMGVHLGAPAGLRVTAQVPWPVPRQYDAGLRLDLVTGLLDALAEEQPGQITAASAWLTRPGEPFLHDRDLEWHAATAHAFGAYDVHLQAFRAVTRTGWLDVVTGEQRVWRRLRL